MVATTGDKKKYKLTHKQVDKTVDSPCIQICTYDEEEEFCIGCYRTKQELQDWWIMTREQKLEALNCLLYTSTSPRDGLLSRMPSSA